MNATLLRRLLSSCRTLDNQPRTLTVSRSDGRLWLSVPRVTSTIRIWVADDDEEFGPRALPCRWVSAAVSRLRDVKFTGTSAGVTLSEGTFSATVHAEGDASPMDNIPIGGVELSAADIASLSWVAPAMARDDDRYGLAGLHVEPDGRVAGTDDHRLHVHPVPALIDLKLPPKMLLPRDWFAQAVKFSGKGGMRVVAENGNVWAIGNGWAVRARLMSADFPDRQQVVPKEATWTLTIPAPDLRAALLRIRNMAMERYVETVRWSVTRDVLTLGESFAGNHSVADAVPGVSGALGYTVGLSAGFLLDAIAGETGPVQFEFGPDNLSPVIVRTATGGMAVVMPVRLG